MSLVTNELTVFVAMPYSDFGKNAKWTKPEHVESFYRTVAARIEEATSRPVRLEIERYRGTSGIVHQAMFDAIYRADIFLADLTGANANVFFELGVRHSVRRSITILTTQESDQPFDVKHMRVVRYANRPDSLAHDEIVEFVKNGLRQADHCDSPVLEHLDLQVVPRQRWERVAGIRVQNLISQGRQQDRSEDRIRLVRQATEDDPFSLEARIELARALRDHQDFGSALDAANHGLIQFGSQVELLKEKALILDRITRTGTDRFEEAIATFQQAVALAPDDADLRCALGGALRRQALRVKDPERHDLLKESYDSYQKATRLQRYDTYAGLNLVRLLVLMEAGSQVEVESQLRRMFHLCAFEVADSELRDDDQRWWKLFDYGDTLVFRKDVSDAIEVYGQAIAMIPSGSRTETLSSPRNAWQELLECGTLDRSTQNCIHDLLTFLDGCETSGQ